MVVLENERLVSSCDGNVEIAIVVDVDHIQSCLSGRHRGVGDCNGIAEYAQFAVLVDCDSITIHGDEVMAVVLKQLCGHRSTYQARTERKLT